MKATAITAFGDNRVGNGCTAHARIGPNVRPQLWVWRLGASAITVIATIALSQPVCAGMLPFGDPWTYPFAINNAGQVMGMAASGSGFLYSDGTMTEFGTLGGEYSRPRAMNEAGDVVGSSPLFRDALWHAFLYRNGVMIDLMTDPDIQGEALDINDAGQIVGYYLDRLVSERMRAFLYDNDVLTDLGTLGGSFSAAIKINEVGQVLGYADTASGEIHAFLWSDGVMTDLGTLGGSGSYPYAINDLGQVVGASSTAGDASEHAFLFSGGVMTDLDGRDGYWSEALDINNQGQVVWVSHSGVEPDCAFLHDSGTTINLGALAGAPGSAAVAINELGQVAGRMETSTGEMHAFLYAGGEVIDLDARGGESDAIGINDSGEIVGFATTPDGYRHASIFSAAHCDPVPRLCNPSRSSRIAALQVRNNDDDRKDHIRWRWVLNGTEPVLFSDFGDPTTRFSLCLYDSTADVATLVARLTIEPSDDWVSRAQKGWDYRDALGSQSGVTKVRMRAGDWKAAKLLVVAKGSNAPLPNPISDTRYFNEDTFVTVQLVTDSSWGCWYSDLWSGITMDNNGTTFRAKTSGRF